MLIPTIDSLWFIPSMAPTTVSGWPNVGVQDVNRKIHSRSLLQEARLLKAYSNGTAPGGSGKKRAIPNLTSIGFLDSVISYLDAPEARNDQDQLWQAFQQLQTDIKAQHAQQNASIQELLSKGTKQQQGQTPTDKYTSWADVAALPAAGSTPTANTHVSTSTARASQLSSLQAKEIRLTVTDLVLKRSLQALEKPNEHILLKANTAISKALGDYHCTSHDHNNGARSTVSTPATAKWIDSVRLMNSGDVFLYAHSAGAVEKLIHSSRKWETFLGEGAEVLIPSYGVVISSIPISSIDMTEQKEIADKLFAGNSALIHSPEEIKRIIWLTKHKKGKNTNAIVVDFYSKATANACIEARKITWEGTPKSTQQYSKKAQVCQCFNCYGFNHTARMCRAKAKCGWCASETHITKDHVNHDKSKYQCINCKGNHAAFSKNCKAHQKEVTRVRAERKRLQYEPLFPTAPALTPSVSERGSRHSSPQGRSPEPSIISTTPVETQRDENAMDEDTPEEPEVQSAQEMDIEDDDASDSEPPTMTPIFTTTETNPILPLTHTPFRAPTNLDGLFGISQAPTPLTDKAPGNRKIKAAMRKL
jgi:hypothetical protein